MKNKRIQKQEVDLIMGINERYREYHDKLQAAKLAEMQAQLQKKPGQKAKEKRDWGNPTNIKEVLSKRKVVGSFLTEGTRGRDREPRQTT